MELTWCRRVGLVASVAACALDGDAVTLVVLHAEGPGANALLAAEHGVHRRVQTHGADAKARVAIVPNDSVAPPSGGVDIGSVKPQEGPLGLAIACTGRAELVDRGVVLDLLGADAGTLAEVLASAAAVPSSSAESARVYGKDGVGARDPRTGATVRRLKDALAGDLDVFLEAWRQRAIQT